MESLSSSSPSVGQFFEQGFERGVGEPCDKVEAVGLENFELDFAAHSSVENKNSVADAEAALEDFHEALKGGGVGGHGEDDLGPVAAVIATVPIAGDVMWPSPFEVNAFEIVEHQAHGFLESSGGEAFFQSAPVASDCVHRCVEIVLFEALFGGWPQAEARRVPRARSLKASLAEGFTNQIGDIGFALLSGFGGLNKHLLHLKAVPLICNNL